ncbi:MAG: phosphatidate cytidylyltransferase [Gammaproteobacteria bacterium]|nr:phosphatidate cytidylyltransferase [Gammaproteobacteria bacterium]
MKAWTNSIGPHNWLAFAVLYIILIAATLIVILLRRRAGKNYIELIERMQSWWLMIILFSLAMLINKVTMIIFFGYISFLALKEYFTMIPTRQIDRRIVFIAYLSIPLQYLLVGFHWYGLFVIFIPLYLFLLIPLRMVTLGETAGFLTSASKIHWGVMLTVYCLSYIAFLGVIPQAAGHNNLRIGYVLYLLFLTQFNDVAQYCWGKLLGKRKLNPNVSPNKTLAGAVGGVITSVILSCIIGPYLTPMGFSMAAIAGVLISCAGLMGDLTLSAVKRDLGIKDTSNLLPGHGGILDRMDSLIFTAPIFFHFMRYFYF